MQEQRKNIKSSKGKGQVAYKGRPIIIIPDFSTETLKPRRAWTEVLQTLREHIPIKATIPYKFLNHPKWKKQNIP